MRSSIKVLSLLGALSLTTLGATARAQDGAAAPPATATPAPEAAPARVPPTPGRWFLHANLAVNAFTWLGETSTQPSRWVTPADKIILLQQLGAGYWVHPNFRLQLTLQFVETLTGRAQNESALSLYGAITWGVFTYKRFFAGAGILWAARSAGKDQFDAGLFLATGVTFPLGRGWGLAAAVQAPVMFVQRVSVAVSPALIVTYRF